MKAVDFIQVAHDLVGGQRNRQHGDAIENHEKIAALWNGWLAIRREPAAPLTAHDVATMMELLKVARRATGAYNSDDYIDGAGYASIAGECAFAEQSRG